LPSEDKRGGGTESRTRAAGRGEQEKKKKKKEHGWGGNLFNGKRLKLESIKRFENLLQRRW